jgi:hypothetical protein
MSSEERHSPPPDAARRDFIAILGQAHPPRLAGQRVQAASLRERVDTPTSVSGRRPGYNTDRADLHLHGAARQTDEIAIRTRISASHHLVGSLWLRAGIGSWTERGTPVHRRHTGDFFEAMDLMKLGPGSGRRVCRPSSRPPYADRVRSRSACRPTPAFRDGEQGVQVDLEFMIDIYENQAKKDVSRARPGLTSRRIPSSSTSREVPSRSPGAAPQ